MFQSLIEEDPKSLSSGDTIELSEEAIGFLITSLEDIPASFVATMKANQTDQEIIALITAIETYGTSASLMAFADHNGILSRTIPGLSSLEQLTGDVSEEDTDKLIMGLESILLGWEDEISADKLRAFRKKRIEAAIACEANRRDLQIPDSPAQVKQKTAARIAASYHDQMDMMRQKQHEHDLKAQQVAHQYRSRADAAAAHRKAATAGSTSGGGKFSGGGVKLFGIIIGFTLAFAAAVLAYKAFRRWKDGDTNRVARVIPFGVLKGLLHGVGEVAHICKTLESLTLPKTEEEWTSFQHRVDSIAAPLKDIGIHVDGYSVKTSELPVSSHIKIESVGYNEGALSELVDMVERTKPVLEELNSVTLSGLIHQYNGIPRTEQVYAGDGYDLIDAIVHTSTVRMTKIIHLTKSIVDSIKHFYKK